MNDRIDIPDFETNKELFDFLVENKQSLIAQKKAILKKGDGISFTPTILSKSGEAVKAESPDELLKLDEIKVVPVINTTNIMDSHKDVHIPGLWSKSLSENKMIMFLQEHKMAFVNIISDQDDLQASVKNFTWKELGQDYEGTTEALVFDANVRKARNGFMFEQYAKGYVKNHSVGMQYVKLVLAINEESYGAEFEAWEKYYPMIVNKDFADSTGYFWAVKEAKIIEGSAVPLGSNTATPTLDVSSKTQPPQGTGNEPPNGTLDIKEFRNEVKNILS